MQYFCARQKYNGVATYAFKVTKRNSKFVHSYKPITIWSKSSAMAAVTYFRLRTIGSHWGKYRLHGIRFKIAILIQSTSTTQAINHNGHVSLCPIGASCSGQDVTWKEVKALYGWWRNSVSSPDLPSNFSRCFIPSACLGAANPSLRQEDHVAGEKI